MVVKVLPFTTSFFVGCRRQDAELVAKQKENEAADSEFVTAVFTYTAQAAAAAEAAEKTEEKAAPAAA